MKAIRVHETGGPEVLQLEDIPVPTPGNEEVLVRMHAIGVNPVDTYVRSGSYYKPQLPYTPGSDGAGIVEKVGGSVSGVFPGMRVYTAGSTTGTYADYAVCRSNQVHPLPDNVTFEQGAGVYVPYATAYRALFQKALAKAGETVLVHGASGGVGIAAVQLARAAGLTVVGTAGTEGGRALVLQQGAHSVVDHTDPNYMEQLKSITEANGYDIILEMLANVNLGNDLALLAREGRVIVIGSRGKAEIMPRDLMSRDTSIIGMALLTVDVRVAEGIHAAIYAGLENQSLRPIVGRTFPLSEASKAHEVIMQAGAHGKIALIP